MPIKSDVRVLDLNEAIYLWMQIAKIADEVTHDDNITWGICIAVSLVQIALETVSTRHIHRLP